MLLFGKIFWSIYACQGFYQPGSIMINGLAYPSIEPLDGGDGQGTSNSTALIFFSSGGVAEKIF